jgi:segregation and condensation protein B
MEKNINEYEGIIESLLFAAGDRLSLDKLTEILELDRGTTRKLINNMIFHFESSKRGIMIREIDNGYQLCTKPEHFEYVKKLNAPRSRQNLSRAAYEVLSIIAYKQPVTRARVEEIRGVNSDSSVVGLVDKGLIKEAGTLDVPGRPKLYRTTQAFLRLFGFRSLKDLPKLEMNEILDIEDMNITEIKEDNKEAHDSIAGNSDKTEKSIDTIEDIEKEVNAENEEAIFNYDFESDFKELEIGEDIFDNGKQEE